MMRVLLVYRSSRGQYNAFRSFRAEPGSTHYHSKLLIEEPSGDSYYFGRVQTLADARQYAGKQFNDIRFHDQGKIDAAAVQFLLTLVRNWRLPNA